MRGYTHKYWISLMHYHSCLFPHCADLLCEPNPDCFSLLSSIVAFKYANQYRQLMPINQSIPIIPWGGGGLKCSASLTRKWHSLKESTDGGDAGGHKHTEPKFWWDWCRKHCPLLATTRTHTLNNRVIVVSGLINFIYFKLSSQWDVQNNEWENTF